MSSEGHDVNALDMARTAYSSTTAQIRTGRATEFELLARITRQLRTTSAAQAVSYTAFVTALNDNHRLWTIFAADLAAKDNALPADLRARLFYLAEFTLQHTAKILAGTATADILIEINTSVMRGLQGEGAPA